MVFKESVSTEFERNLCHPVVGPKEGFLFVRTSISLRGMKRALVSGVEKLTRSSLKGFLHRALFAYKNGRFASSFLLLGVGF